ncbi:hypothetical protein [Chromobacterium violaceum]|uniref:hypothetical protein n=1 Tax=Chromobacterium violaceum TaxID=536 RepID=UPI001B3376FD|nr:hypothetical protein [Chromobacterium violaceum]
MRMTGTEILILFVAWLIIWGAKTAYAKRLDAKIREQELAVQHAWAEASAEHARFVSRWAARAASRPKTLPAPATWPQSDNVDVTTAGNPAELV